MYEDRDDGWFRYQGTFLREVFSCRILMLSRYRWFEWKYMWFRAWAVQWPCFEAQKMHCTFEILKNWLIWKGECILNKLEPEEWQAFLQHPKNLWTTVYIKSRQPKIYLDDDGYDVMPIFPFPSRNFLGSRDLIWPWLVEVSATERGWLSKKEIFGSSITFLFILSFFAVLRLHANLNMKTAQKDLLHAV